MKNMWGKNPEDQLDWAIKGLEQRMQFMQGLARPLTHSEQLHVDAIRSALPLLKKACQVLGTDDYPAP